MLGGRPKIEIDFDLLDKLCQMQATLVEVAGFFDCSEDTIDRRIHEEFGICFAEYLKKKSAKGKISLRRSQFQSAVEKGNVAMQIFLGKQWLGQSDNPQAGTEVFDKIADFINNFRVIDDKSETITDNSAGE